MELVPILTIAGIILVALAVIGFILARLYQRATKETSLVRTGMGGQKVIMNGGALVLPVLHEIVDVNMQTLRLEVRRANEQALITKDRLRVDVVAEFYVRVRPTADAIAFAAQTLGKRTMNPSHLGELVEGKFVDALRAVAAQMTMEELHEQRVEFVQKVQNAVSEELSKNGLELETAALTGLDQTEREYFKVDNAFDAQGLTKLTEEIEERRRLRNDIEQDTEVRVRQKNLEAEQIKLQMIRDEEYAKLEQQREIEIRKANQEAEIAREQAQRSREADEARIIATKEVETAQIQSERVVEQSRIEKNQEIREREIGAARAVELAGQDKDIAVAERSRAQSEAQAEADRVRAEAVKERENVETVQKVAEAERRKAVLLVDARQDAEKDAIRVTVEAEAEKRAAEDEASAMKLRAEGDAQAEIIRANAAERRYAVDAAGKEAIHNAENVLSAQMIELRMKLALLESLPNIIAESVKPMEQIDGIKILHVDGLTGGGGNGHANGVGGGNGSGNLADQVVSSALRYRAQAPLLDSLLKDIGLDGADINGLAKALDETAAASNGQEPPMVEAGDGDAAGEPEAPAEIDGPSNGAEPVPAAAQSKATPKSNAPGGSAST